MVAIIIENSEVLRPDETHVTLNEAVGSIAELTFTVGADNPLYERLTNAGIRVKAFDTITQKEIFEGRTLLPEKRMDSGGAVSLTVTCEEITAVLRDGIVYGNFRRVLQTPVAAEMILNQHNALVSEGSQVKVGTIKNISLGEDLDLDYCTTYDAVAQLAALCGLEFRIARADSGELRLDMADTFAEYTGESIELAKNMRTLTKSQDMSGGLVNRIIPLSGIGYDGKRLTVEHYMGRGSIYIDNPELVEKYGAYYCAAVVFDDIVLDDPQYYLEKVTQLYSRGWDHAQSLSDVPICYQSEIYDPEGAVECGNFYHVANPLLSTNEVLRVVGKRTDFDNRAHPSITIGSAPPTMTRSASNQIADIKQSVTRVAITSTSIANGAVSEALGGMSFKIISRADFDSLTAKSAVTSYYVKEIDGSVKLYLGDVEISGGGGGSDVLTSTRAAAKVTSAFGFAAQATEK